MRNNTLNQADIGFVGGLCRSFGRGLIAHLGILLSLDKCLATGAAIGKQAGYAALLLAGVAPAAIAQIPTAQTGLYDAFDARPLDRQEKLGLQTALAHAGDYDGPLDGLWGEGTQAAIERWAARIEGRAPLNLDVARLLGDFARAAVDDGWEWVDPLGQDVPVLLPLNRMQQDGALWRDAGGLVISQQAQPPEHSAATHETMRRLRRSADLWLSEASQHGLLLWLRSDRRGAVMIDTQVAQPEGAAAQGALLIRASVGLRDQPRIGVTEGGQAQQWIAGAEALTIAPDPASPPQGQSSGSGFRLTPEGAVLTSRHVIAGCASPMIDGNPARILATGEDSDMALLDGATEGGWLSLSADAPALNADVTVAGFPLNGLLGGINVTRGAVSGETGIEGNPQQFQISAPIQPGSSGGPVVDARGQVTGIVLAKLDDMLTAAEWGIIAQNVNFAMRITPATDLAREAGLTLPPAQPAPDTPEAMGALLKSATVLIECADPPQAGWASPLTGE